MQQLRHGVRRIHSPAATILKGGILRTNVRYRPFPTLFTYPGLSSRPWHDKSDFPWTQLLQDNYEEIRQEYDALVEAGVKTDYDIGAQEHTLHSGQWDWYSYIHKGKKQEEFAKRCPKTTEVLESIPGLMSGIPFAYAFFSTLKPGGNIEAHYGPCNLRIRCHLPLYAPPGGGIRVAEEVRTWEEGEPLVFDDSYEHEVWHTGTEDRVILLFDVWHPQLRPEEIEAITSMFEDARQKGWIS